MAQDQKRLTAEAQLSSLPVPMGEASWAHDVRARARARLLEAGSPARRDEYWRNTDPRTLTQPLAPAGPADADGTPPDFGTDARLVRFVNGRLREDLSLAPGAPGLAAQPLGDALKQDITIARELFGVLETAGQEKVDRPLAILNTATATDGLVLQATGDAAPLHLHYDRIGEGASTLRHVIRVESGASLTILESGSASNVVMEIDLAPGAVFHHVRIQSGMHEPTATHIFARIGGEAALRSFTLTADGTMTRNEIVLDLVGADASGHVGGAILAENSSHVDNTVFVTHSSVNGESRQVYKNVLGGKAKAIFQGKIFVREGAQKTDGYQISQSVLLNDGCEFLAKPELEIYADDVACSHGSTTGALDPTAMFYLQSRGVRRAEAEAMLIAAFADEAIEEIENDDLADAMRAEVARWMSNRA
ncbi:MAG: SufD family Fe-S cluster assembly protein [Pseudomonadota bacterium]